MNVIVGLLALVALGEAIAIVFLRARLDDARRPGKLFDVGQFDRAPDRLRDRTPW